MKIEVVTVCVNCADFLAHTLPINRAHFDLFVVVTAPEDEATQRVCSHWGVHCKVTDATMSRWGLFRKGDAINEGLNMLEYSDWIAHIDCDTVLPAHFRGIVEESDLDPRSIYGCDRQMFRSYEQWANFMANPEPQIVEDILIRPSNGAPLGDRVYFPGRGWFPLGFFQLWNRASGITRYISDQENAGHDDGAFACQWPRRNRGFLPEIIAYHLESQPLPLGANWKKRQSKPFCIGG